MRDSLTTRLTTAALALVAVPLLAGCQPAEQAGMQEGAAVDTAAILETLDGVRDGYAEAFNAGDADGVAALYTEDAVLMPSTGSPVTGRDAIRDLMAENLAQEPTLEIMPANTTVMSSDWVVEYGTTRTTVEGAEEEDPVTQSQGYLVVLKRTADGWKLLRAANTLLDMPSAEE